MAHALIFTVLNVALVLGAMSILVWLLRRHRYGLSIAFGVLWAVSLFLFSWNQWQVYTHDQKTHDQPVEIAEYYEEAAKASTENIQS